MKKMTLTDLEVISGSANKGFCQGLYVAETIWGVGIIANVWNPPGAVAAVALLAGNGYCAFF